MKKLYLAAVILLGMTLMLSTGAFCQDDAGKQKADQLVNKINETSQQYTASADNFDCTVTIKVGDKTETLTLKVDDSLKVPKNMPPVEGMCTWKNITEYENNVMMKQDPNDQRVKWFIENMQTDRMNRILKELTESLKSDWEKNNPGQKGPDKLYFYVPGNNDSEKYAYIGNIINQLVIDLGMMELTPFSNVGWGEKFVTGDERLYKPDLNELCQAEGLVQYYSYVEPLLTDLPGASP
jgi:hypothetical protein